MMIIQIKDVPMGESLKKSLEKFMRAACEIRDEFDNQLGPIESNNFCKLVEKTGFLVGHYALNICIQYLKHKGYNDDIDLFIPQGIILYSRFPQLYYTTNSYSVTYGSYNPNADIVDLYGLSDRINIWQLPGVLIHEMAHRYQYQTHQFDKEMKEATNNRDYSDAATRKSYEFEMDADTFMNEILKFNNLNREIITVDKLIKNDIADLYTIFALRECRIALIANNRNVSVFKYSFIDVNDNNEYYLRSVTPNKDEQNE